jgi:hypothetical protein
MIIKIKVSGLKIPQQLQKEFVRNNHFIIYFFVLHRYLHINKFLIEIIWTLNVTHKTRSFKLCPVWFQFTRSFKR